MGLAGPREHVPTAAPAGFRQKTDREGAQSHAEGGGLQSSAETLSFQFAAPFWLTAPVAHLQDEHGSPSYITTHSSSDLQVRSNCEAS
jgi:hypothetical protein